MGGVGSGGRSKPEDREVADHWEKLTPIDASDLRTVQVRCRHCGKVRAKNTTRQREHQLSCQAYLNAMGGVGGSNPAAAQNPRPENRSENIVELDSSSNSTPNPPPQKPNEKKGGGRPNHTVAVRIQALALAEAGFDAQRVWKITGVAPWTLSYIKKTARARGYNPDVSMQLKEEYVVEGKRSGRPKRNAQGQILNASRQLPSQYMAPAHQVALQQFLAPPQPTSQPASQPIPAPPQPLNQVQSLPSLQHMMSGHYHQAIPPSGTFQRPPPGLEASNTAPIGRPPRPDNREATVPDGSIPPRNAPVVFAQAGNHRIQETSPEVQIISDDDATIDIESNQENDQQDVITVQTPNRVASRETPNEAASDPQPGGQKPIASGEKALYQLHAILNADSPPARTAPTPSIPLPNIPMSGAVVPGIPMPVPEMPRQRRRYNRKPKPMVPFHPLQNTTTSTPTTFTANGIRLPPGNWNFAMTTP